MAQEAEQEKEGGGEEEAPKKKFPLWVIILIASQVVLVIVAVVVLKMLSGSKAASEKHEEPSQAEQKVDPEKLKDPKLLGGPQYKLQPFIVNLIDDGRGPKFLKVEINFELETPPGYKPPAAASGGGEHGGGGSASPESEIPVKAELDSRANQIRDELLMLLTSKRQTDIESSDGKRILRDEIFTRVNKILVTGAIRRVFFTEFVIQ